MTPRPTRDRTAERLDRLIEEATVDAYGDDESASAWEVALEDHVAVPFETTVLGVPVTVERITVGAANSVVAICRRGRYRQAVPVLDLPLPDPPPRGAEWIAAYRRWCGPR